METLNVMKLRLVGRQTTFVAECHPQKRSAELLHPLVTIHLRRRHPMDCGRDLEPLPDLPILSVPMRKEPSRDRPAVSRDDPALFPRLMAGRKSRLERPSPSIPAGGVPIRNLLGFLSMTGGRLPHSSTGSGDYQVAAQKSSSMGLCPTCGRLYPARDRLQ